MKNLTFMTLALLALVACETQSAGTGSGNVSGTQKPVAFTWQSTDDISGDITATFGSGRVFKGSYFQITRDTRVERLDPLWDGWGRPYRRNTWRHWDRESCSEFIKSYSGRVLANLHSDDGEHMRCRFTLISPQRGMAGGGEGRCQLSESGREINAEFPRQS
jgi:hypothetical protein